MYKREGSLIVLMLLIFVFSTSAYAGKEKNTDKHNTNSQWYVTNGVFCKPGDPRAIIGMAQMMGESVKTKDVKEKGVVVSTTVSMSDGSSMQFFRGLKRCNKYVHPKNNLNKYN